MIIDEIWVPDSLKNPKAMRKYADIILDFKESNKIKSMMCHSTFKGGVWKGTHALDAQETTTPWKVWFSVKFLDIKPIGLIGSYCQAGQEYFAYQVAMEIENPLNLSNLKKARLDDLIVRR